MAITSETNRVDYVGSGSVDTYAYPFRIFAATDLLVTQTNTSGVETTFTLDTDYTVAAAEIGNEDGGDVVLEEDLPSDYLLTIRRVRPITQETDIRNQGSFFPETHEDAFDHGIMVDQQQQDEIDRSVKLPETVAAEDFDVTLPSDITDSNSQLLAVNADGDGFELVANSGSTSIAIKQGIGNVSNLGMSYSSGTLTIAGEDGTALSSTNPAFFQMMSTTSSRGVRLKLTANVTMTDSTHATDSDIVGEQFGVTTGVVWNQDRPFFLYAVNTDDTDAGLYLALSPCPCAIQTPANSDRIGYKDVPGVTPTDRNFFFLTSTNVTSMAQKPAMIIGGIRMSMNASDDWAVSSVDYTEGDGIRKDPYVGKIFTMPISGQMGASNIYFAGLSPTWASFLSLVMTYGIDLNGVCRVNLTTSSGGNCTNGGDSNPARIVRPYSSLDTAFHTNTRNLPPAGYVRLNNTASFVAPILAADGTGTCTLVLSDQTVVTNDAFANAADDLVINFQFKAFSHVI